MSWKQDQSFMININESQLNLTGKKVQNIEVNGTQLINPYETASNHFYWLSVPTSEEGTEYNRTEQISNFVTELEISNTESDGRIVYKPIPIKITYK
ncbi:lipase acylhydrolase domain protein [Staphylococcus virus vB_SurM-PSU6]|nr:lipase acylhydrolase domain protein [Staphylococcus virus vB_SurM-PSU6]